MYIMVISNVKGKSLKEIYFPKNMICTWILWFYYLISLRGNGCNIAGESPLVPVVKAEMEGRVVVKSEQMEKSEDRHVFDADVVKRRMRSAKNKKGKSSERLDTLRIPTKLELDGENEKLKINAEGNFADDIFEEMLHCYACGVSFRYIKHYVNHRQRIHGDDKPFKCRYCREDFPYRYSLKNHVDKKHAVENNPYAGRSFSQPVSCAVCGEIRYGFAQLENHALVAHEGVRTIACPRCSKKFFRRHVLVDHMRRTHADADVAFRCKFCNNTFDRTDVLKNHAEDCEQNQNFIRTGNNKMNMIKTEREQLDCEECGLHFSTFKQMKRHYATKHPDHRMYSCGYCEAAFAMKKSLKKHTNMRHVDKAASFGEKFVKGRVYTCEYCGEEIAGLVNFENHGKQHPGRAMFYCKDCGKGFRYRGSLKMHANEKHGDMKTRCSHCSKCYYKPRRLQEHEEACKRKIDRTERLKKEGYPGHYCHVCKNEFFVKPSSFAVHVLRHKEYDRCDICNEGFHRTRNPNGLAEHQRVRHPLKDNIAALLQTIIEAKNIKREV